MATQLNPTMVPSSHAPTHGRYKKSLHQAQYKARYASVQEAMELEKSTFRRLYGIPSAEKG